jgi:hypothetical protein
MLYMLSIYCYNEAVHVWAKMLHKRRKKLPDSMHTLDPSFAAVGAYWNMSNVCFFNIMASAIINILPLDIIFKFYVQIL